MHTAKAFVIGLAMVLVAGVPALVAARLVLDAWRTAPVDVHIKAPGFEHLDFTWTVATADADHTLIPAR